MVLYMYMKVSRRFVLLTAGFVSLFFISLFGGNKSTSNFFGIDFFLDKVNADMSFPTEGVAEGAGAGAGGCGEGGCGEGGAGCSCEGV